MPDEPKFPYSSIIVHTETLYQADCERCGWHTRQADSENWVLQMAEGHFAVCPNPRYRIGALMECGCWYYAMVGDAVGETTTICPLHGKTVMVKVNVKEPVAYGRGQWTPEEGSRQAGCPKCGGPLDSDGRCLSGAPL